jgi:hypothetical protein
MAMIAAPAPAPGACGFDPDRGAILMGVGMKITQPVKAGERVKVDPQYSTHPGAFDPIAAKCLRGWKVSNPKIARLSRDGKTLIVAADAPAGAEFVVTASYRGKTVEQRFKIFVPVQSPLVGFWSQEQVAACADPTKLFDLVFEANGDFAVAFGPTFHGSKDYRGRWRVEGDRLFLSDVTGARPADFASEARFVIDGKGGLTFERPWFGTQGERGKCAAPFKHLR